MGFSSSQLLNMKIFVAIAFLVAVAECRRHLCDGGYRPICPDGTKAVYNRPTGKNTDIPVCNGEGKPVCADGSEASPRFNVCTKDQLKCPKGQGSGADDKPFPACADGSQCKCPMGGDGCQFRYKRCSNGQSCRKQCKSGVPHCPWWTKNRNKHDGIRTYNTGANRPGNKAKNWGPGFAGNKPLNGLTGVISEHPREGHPTFIRKPACP